MTNFILNRASKSGYFPSNFDSLEMSSLKLISKIKVDLSSKYPDIIITSSDTPVSKLSSDGYFSNAKLVIHPNSGHDNFSYDFVQNANFPIILGNSIRKNAVSEYCLSTIFHHFAVLPHLEKWDTARQWPRKLLRDQRVLVYGKGHIGNILNSALKPLVRSIDFEDPFKKVTCTHKLSEIDIIIFAMSLNPTSLNFANKSLFQKLKEDVVLINPARGKIINWKDLTDYLQENTSAKAYVDVFPEEPFPIERYSQLKNLFCSSHVAGVFKNICPEIIRFESDIIKDFINLDLKNFEYKYKSLNLRNKIHGDYII